MDFRPRWSAACRGGILVWFAISYVPAFGLHSRSKRFIGRGSGFHEEIPEADHNTLAGAMNPEEVLNPHTMTLFLRAPSDHLRNRLRSDLTRKAFMLEGMNTDYIDARGNTPLAHMWTLILFGDYVSYYLSMGYD